MKTRLIRQKYNGINSQFSIKAKFITHVYDNEGNELKFYYNISNDELTILGDYVGIYVLYQ